MRGGVGQGVIDQLVSGVASVAVVTTITNPAGFPRVAGRMQVQPVSDSEVVAGKLTNGDVRRVEKIAALRRCGG